MADICESRTLADLLPAPDERTARRLLAILRCVPSEAA